MPSPAPELPLHAYHLRAGAHAWSILHTGVVLSHDDEQRYLSERVPRESHPPYGVALWPAALALAHDILARADEVRGASVLELGAGTGLPGIVAATLGARVVQTDRQELAMAICRENGARNGVASSIAYRVVDWQAWDDDAPYDLIIGADILYAERMHAPLRRIFEASLAPRGRVLLADPFRAASLPLLEAMEGDGWRIALAKWNVGEEFAARPIGVYELTKGR